jgi:hypothetical protein
MDQAAIERARGADIHAVALSLGVRFKPARAGGRERVGRCPRGCARDDGFSVNTREQVFFCRPAGSGGKVISMVMHVRGCSRAEAVAFIVEGSPSGAIGAAPKQRCKAEKTDPAREAAKALALWRRRRPVEGSVAERYLRQARRYGGPIPATLGFLPDSGQYPPSLIAAFGMADEPECGAAAITDGAVRAVHLIRLLPDGADRTEKITVGAGAMGASIVLFPVNDLLGLAITEGIEDGLSVHEATGLGVWVAGSAPRMPALADAVPAYVECVTVFRDDDESGRRYATELARRLDARGFETLLKPLSRRGAANGQD